MTLQDNVLKKTSAAPLTRKNTVLILPTILLQIITTPLVMGKCSIAMIGVALKTRSIVKESVKIAGAWAKDTDRPLLSSLQISMVKRL